MAADAIVAFREQYRREHVPPGYAGWRHLLFTFGIGSAAVVAAILQLEQVGLSGFLCARHMMTHRSRYAEQAQEERGSRVCVRGEHSP